MDLKTLTKVASLLNAFPQGTEDTELRLSAMAEATQGLPGEAIEQAAGRFLRGEVTGQQTRRAPTVPEFAQEARRCADALRIAAQPIPAAVGYVRGEKAPFEVTLERKRAENRHRPVLATGIDFDTYRKTWRQYPPGHSWIAALGTVYGP